MELQSQIELVFSEDDLDIQKSNIFQLLGYGKQNADEHVKEIVEKCLNESKELIKQKGIINIYKNERLNYTSGKIKITEQTINIGKIISAQIRNSEFIAFFACTIGKGIENFSKEKMKAGDMLEGYIFDLIGSEAAEETAEKVHEYVRILADKERLHVTNRFSPGYCNWDVKEQFKLFSFFSEANIGIKLTSSALMDPVKSVSGIIGIGPEVKYRPYTCSMCNDDKCIYRNRKIRTF